MKNNVHVPKEAVNHNKKRDKWAHFDESNDDSEDIHDKEGNKREVSNDANDSADEDDKIKHEKKKKDKAQCPF